MKRLLLFMLLIITLSLSAFGCSKNRKNSEEGPKSNLVQQPDTDKLVGDTQDSAAQSEKGTDTSNPGENTGDYKHKPDAQNTLPGNIEQSTKPEIDLDKIKPNEAGKIMVVMFHNFIETYKSGDKEFTTTFDDFSKLLDTLYDSGYRLISMEDFLNNNISVPAGCIPMVFTFDDGTSGQFSLVEHDGILVASSKSAVGIMEEFNKTHPDFGLKGVFYVNLGLNTFEGKGNISERLKYLIDRGFEIGNHTYTHVELNKIKSSDKIQQEIGKNQKRMYELIPGYKMASFSLPYGLPAKELRDYVEKGEYEGIQYKNSAIMEVGWDPSVSPISRQFNPLSIHRVRASGIVPVNADLGWWLKQLSRAEQYISDGDPDTITIPKSKEKELDLDRLDQKKLVIY